ncbi:MAG: hypothetical protein KGL72_01155 [Actinomycetales bacterium]|nr:hypothetical protein [Actinomycetales bacterium]
MKTSSLNRVHQELHAAWQRGEPVELQRIGDRKFVVGEVAVPAGEFVFNNGFTEAPTEQSSRTQRARHRMEPASGGRRKKLSRKTLAIIVIASVALVAWKGYRVTTVLNEALKTHEVNRAEVLRQLPVSQRKTYTKALDSCLNTVPPVPLDKGLKMLTVQRDITIGGERQQEILIDCGVEKRVMTVRYSFSQGSWHVKSATPSGSRSLLSSN